MYKKVYSILTSENKSLRSINYFSSVITKVVFKIVHTGFAFIIISNIKYYIIYFSFNRKYLLIINWNFLFFSFLQNPIIIDDTTPEQPGWTLFHPLFFLCVCFLFLDGSLVYVNNHLKRTSDLVL